MHGDLKPGNVLLMEDGTARLGDFNMAAELEGTHAYSPAFATADYTPPELLWSEVGERGMQIRQIADIWAFGVLAHLVLTGPFPLAGGTPPARRKTVARYARGEEELRRPLLTAAAAVPAPIGAPPIVAPSRADAPHTGHLSATADDTAAVVVSGGGHICGTATGRKPNGCWCGPWRKRCAVRAAGPTPAH